MREGGVPGTASLARLPVLHEGRRKPEESAPAQRTSTSEPDEALTLVYHLQRSALIRTQWPSKTRWQILGEASTRQLNVMVKDRRDLFGLEGVSAVSGHQVKLAALLEAFSPEPRA